MIYEHALPVVKRFRRYTESAEHSKHISLLFVDRITYKEALPVFIKSNGFILTASDCLACADMSFFRFIESLMILHLGDMRIKVRAVRFQDGEGSDLGEELLNVLVQMPRLRYALVEDGPDHSNEEEPRQHGAIREFLELQGRLPSTNLGKTHSLVMTDMSVYCLVLTEDPGAYPMIVFIDRHFQDALTDYHNLCSQAIEESDFIDRHGESLLEKIQDWTSVLHTALRAPYGTNIRLPPAMARTWTEDELAGCHVDDLLDI